VALADGSKLTGTADHPSDPGIFRPTVRPEKPGDCNLEVVVVRDGLTDRISAGSCKIFANESAARAALAEEAEPAGRITYLKEQQWKTDLVTTEVSQRDLRDSVQANGEIQPAGGKDARTVAPASGRATFGAGTISIVTRGRFSGSGRRTGRVGSHRTDRHSGGTRRARGTP